MFTKSVLQKSFIILLIYFFVLTKTELFNFNALHCYTDITLKFFVGTKIMRIRR